MTFLWILVAMAAVVAAYVVGRTSVPKPQPPAPVPPKPFGLVQAETVARKLNGLTAVQAQAAAVAAVVGGMDYTLPADVKVTRANLAQRVTEKKEEIKFLEAEIASNQVVITTAKNRDGEVASLAAAFGL